MAPTMTTAIATTAIALSRQSRILAPMSGTATTAGPTGCAWRPRSPGRGDSAAVPTTTR